MRKSSKSSQLTPTYSLPPSVIHFLRNRACCRKGAFIQVFDWTKTGLCCHCVWSLSELHLQRLRLRRQYRGGQNNWGTLQHKLLDCAASNLAPIYSLLTQWRRCLSHLWHSQVTLAAFPCITPSQPEETSLSSITKSWVISQKSTSTEEARRSEANVAFLINSIMLNVYWKNRLFDRDNRISGLRKAGIISIF